MWVFDAHKESREAGEIESSEHQLACCWFYPLYQKKEQTTTIKNSVLWMTTFKNGEIKAEKRKVSPLASEKDWTHVYLCTPNCRVFGGQLDT